MTNGAVTDRSSTRRPRLPVRANGQRRYDQLLDAAERLLARSGSEALTIRALAHEASVPMASVYHFLPHPAAVSIALAERYLAGLEACICAPIAAVAGLSWGEMVAILNRRAVAFYQKHPYAQVLILGSDYSLAIRRADLANNRRIAAAVAGFLRDALPGTGPDELLEIVVTGITIGDAIFSLSVIEAGAISDTAAREAWLAVCGYLSARFQIALPDPQSYSIFI